MNASDDGGEVGACTMQWLTHAVAAAVQSAAFVDLCGGSWWLRAVRG